ncbi:serine/arginine repetitive matrix protein 2-like isoform X2 [Condylostylus longicornis]|uniref:serine/arginine repetitive matrix protein 2-like isoform X2 n=1 Tax=Condylostylus longicornis TaxID=2530218 RepID=UPI00244E4BAF|nr:serine/arginine repetitive matrix protein 2-like isoform X2 [Condylostylus longicornis]
MAKLRQYRSMDVQPTTTNIRKKLGKQDKKTMTSICFVCNLPIMSHQVGLVWQGGNGWDDLVREQLEESTIRQRLGGRRDSAAQIITPPSTSPPPGATRRRRSSLAQLTDILREWSGGGSKRNKPPLNRRETLADLARSLPWAKSTADAGTGTTSTVAAPTKKRRESSCDSGIRSMKSRRESHTSEFARQWNRRESTSPAERDREETSTSAECTRNGSRRGSGDSYRSGRRDSIAGRPTTPPPPKMVNAATKKRRDSLAAPDFPNFRTEQRPSTSSTASDSNPVIPISASAQIDSACQALPPPTIITSSVTPPATSPTAPKARRDSTTQCGRLNRRDSKVVSPEKTPRLQRLQRQATAYDESCFPGGNGRRGSQPALSPDPPEDFERKARRDSLSPDSASRGRRDSRSHLSPDRSHERETSPRRSRRTRRQSSSAGHGGSRTPDSSSCCSSRDPSPCARPPPDRGENNRESSGRPSAVRRQSTTEEILIARGFRRQSTTEEMIRCRNFRRQSSQSDDVCRYRGRRDSCAQIIDGTIGTMTIETTSTFFDSSTQTGKSC